MRLAFALAAFAPLASAQLFTLTKDQLIRITAKNPYERFEDGRPKVPDAVLEKVKGLSSEEIWGVLPGAGFRNQYEGNWQLLHPGKKMVGRVVTAQFMPVRPDVMEYIDAEMKQRNPLGGPHHQWAIDQLKPGDVIVVDLFGKIDGGTFVGDNLATAIYALSKGAGMVVDGGIRDLEGIFPLDMAAYFRGAHPSAIRDVMMTGFNVPIRVGNATVMPGDVAFGDREGVYFIPPHLVEQVTKRAEETHVHDEWTKEKLLSGKYKSIEVYGSPRLEELKKEYREYVEKKLGPRPARPQTKK
ncbi:MAG: dimethylmenaquinone methyltransferase [Bryobacteraceae bacterium]|nr:dimethylmenaquinone methyltransferase [Bryobacteraceae bacterium]